MTVLAAPPTGVGVSNGANRRMPFDRWFRYPAGLSQDALSFLFDEAYNPPGSIVVDPFAGAATVGTRAIANQRPFKGVEAHPEIAELGALKLQTPPDIDAIEKAAERVACARAAASIQSEPELVRRCFDAQVLATLTGLREAVRAADVDELTRCYLKWGLLATLRDVANVKVGWPYLRPDLSRTPPHADAAGRFQTRVEWMVDDLRGRSDALAGEVVAGDAADASTWTKFADSVKGTVCVTSPPYLNNFDYADATRLEMYFWGRNSTWAEMVADVRSDMLIATTQQAGQDMAEAALEDLADLEDTHTSIADLVARLQVEKKKRKAGKEYDRVLPSYALGIRDVLANLTSQLEPGSWCGWVVGDSAPYGIYVDTPGIIQRIALELGYTNPESQVLRSRGLRWRTNGTRHQVALDERIVWMKTPDGVGT